ncbi:hypothetical protein [Gordonia insulae]|uniref:Uncharacterized protein n=1 Tax=Gordonia insulae TaxID=2420509 RepID=A0A3G8JQ04_9ACTN|nr:hypothetical protein [Gordonia insulae]AZG46765.1 hypothetical protein D7316_03369 [Gordonia insulae]
METTTPPPAPLAGDAVVIDDDATPIVRLLGRTLRDSFRTGHAVDSLEHLSGSVAVRSHNTPQAATVVLRDGAATVTGGTAGRTDAALILDLDDRLAAVATDGDPLLAGAVRQALCPPLPSWRDAAARFWDLTRGIRGIPDVLVAVALGPDGPEEARFGTGADTYRIVGTPDLLAGVFTGADYLLSALERGLRVQGTLSQLSVTTAASWKVRFDV